MSDTERSERSDFWEDPRDPPNIAELEEKFLNTLSKEHQSHPWVTRPTRMRFLRARKYVIPDAVKMLVDTLEMRAKYDVDRLLANPPDEINEDLAKYLAFQWHGYDKHGCPILIVKLGECRNEKMQERFSIPDWCTSHLHMMEETMDVKNIEGAKLVGKQPEDTAMLTTIMDLEGLDWGCRKFFNFLKVMTDIDKGYYPESVAKVFLINTPSIFPMVWKVVKPWIDPMTVTKIEIFTAAEDPKPRMRARIDLSSLPPEYGGECTREECKEKGFCVASLPEIDWKELDEQKDKNAEASMTLQKETIKAGKKFIFQHQVTPDVVSEYPGGAVELEVYFKTASNDIRFSAEFTPAGSKAPVVVNHPGTYLSYISAGVRRLTVNGAGTLCLIWDNSASYWNSKHLTFGIRNLPYTPKTMEEDDEEKKEGAEDEVVEHEE